MMLVDSNVFIFAENSNSEEHEAAIKRIKATLNREPLGINLIIASETFHILSRLLGVEQAASRVTNIVENPLVEWLDFQAKDFTKAVGLSRTFQIRINDALIAQQAMAYGIPVLTDNLKDFRKIKGLQVVPLRYGV